MSTASYEGGGMATVAEPLTVADSARRRRSIRTYHPAPIPAADLAAILDLTRLAPSAFNAQPWRFVVVQDPAIKGELVTAAKGQRQVASAPAVIVLYTDMADVLENLDQVFHPGIDGANRARMAAGIAAMFRDKTPLEREAWGAAQGHIALGFLLLAAESHGYQTSPMAGFDPEAVKRILGLPSHVHVPALIAIGRGAEAGAEHHRHPLDRIVRIV